MQVLTVLPWGFVIFVFIMIPAVIKQFAYFGFGITFLSAFIAHTAVGDAFSYAVMPLIFLGILVASYYFNSSRLKSSPINN